MDSFSEWIQSQLDQRGWKQADLARASGLDSAVISNVINQRRKAGEVVCRAIAKAFNLPPETVFRSAGILPDHPSDQPPNLAEWIQIFMQADEGTREDMLEYAQFKADKARRAHSANPVDSPLD